MSGMSKVNLVGMDEDALRDLFERLGERPYRAVQVSRWIYRRGCRDIDGMTDLSRSLRERLDRTATIEIPRVESVAESRDGSMKFLYRLGDGLAVEGVLIPEENRDTLCLSTQVGCALGCLFCKTARSGFRRQLTRDEIVGQVLAVQQYCDRPVSNLVLMGMGEPLLNTKEVFAALRIFITESGFQIAKRRITVSTAGIVPEIPKIFVGELKDIGLAVSLNAATDDLRDRLMPVNRRYPLRPLVDLCRFHARRSRRRITFEYVMIAGVNDRPRDGSALVRLLRGFPCKINLIPFNTFPGTEFIKPTRADMEKFQDHLFEKLNITVIVRDSRGGDIGGACGQLANPDSGG